LRKDICDSVRRGTIGRDQLTFKLDELHVLALKPAVVDIEPNSAGEIGSMKKWTMSTLARPGPMALVEDGVLFGFIATKLMAQDASLVEESVVDEEFATFLTRSNTIQKSLTAAMARAKGSSDKVQPPQRVSVCPKCHFGHSLRECTAQYATLSRNGPRNHNWLEKPPVRSRMSGDGGGGAPYGARPAILAP
jgi:hypothetical protein